MRAAIAMHGWPDQFLQKAAQADRPPLATKIRTLRDAARATG